MRILVVNAGSSSVKLSLLDGDDDDRVLAAATLDPSEDVATALDEHGLRFAHAVVVLLMALSVISSALLLVGAVFRQDIFQDSRLSGFDRDYHTFVTSVPAATFAFAVGCIVLVAVAASRRAFPARLAPGSRVAAFVVLVAGLAVSFVVTVAVTTAAPQALHGTREIMRFAFEDLGLHKVTIGCISDNLASKKVIEGLGFRFLCEQIDHCHRHGRWWNHLGYELTVDEWRATRTASSPDPRAAGR